MMRVVPVLIFTLALLTGCGNSEPAQPKVTEEQVKEIMKNAKEQSQKEGGDRYKGKN